MQPNLPFNPQSPNTPVVPPHRPLAGPVPAPIAQNQRPHTETHAAAADIVRSQIDTIYSTNPPHKETIDNLQSQQAAPPQPDIQQATAETVYGRTHTRPSVMTEAPEQLQQYHSAWQSYYRQYYERYYLHQLHATRSQLEAKAQAAARTQALPATSSAAVEPAPQIISSTEATHELKNDLLQKIRTRAAAVRKSRHFMPIISAVVVGLVFAVLQYNRVLVAQVHAYVSPGSINPQNIVLDPTTDIKVSKEPKVIIPKINVEAPVVYGLNSIAEPTVQKALESGVVHYPIPGANSVPGQVGNTVLLGHSSNDVFDNGGYKFIFVQLDQLKKGDTFYIHYEGTRYTYSVSYKEVIEPTDIHKLTQKTDKPLVTLLTCTPPGTALKRLIVVAEQISPDPAGASSAPQQNTSNEPAQLPANSPTLLERVFGGGR
ncbi:MAG TPA: sortase [Verrucomicrobiae bacterium]|nr:sortase [Verrucomicrobiae bacterium]